MKCMRAVSLFISFLLLVSVEAFAGYGNFGTIVKTAHDAQNALDVSENPNFKQPAVWNSDCDKAASLENVNLIPKNGKDDPRRELKAKEKQDASGVGYFHLSGNKQRPIGTAFLAENRRVLLTAAHNFVRNGDWKAEMKNSDGSLNLSKAEFFSDVCNKSYKIENIEVLTKDADKNRDDDVGAVLLSEPLCEAAQPLTPKIFSSVELEQISKLGKDSIGLPAYQPYKRASGQQKSGEQSFDKSNQTSNNKWFDKLIAYGEILEFTQGGNDKIITHTASTLPGASGGPVMAFVRGQPVSIAINVSEFADGTYNMARVIDQDVIDLMSKVANKK